MDLKPGPSRKKRRVCTKKNIRGKEETHEVASEKEIMDWIYSQVRIHSASNYGRENRRE